MQNCLQGGRMSDTFGGKRKTRKPINRNVINMTKLRDPVNAEKIKRGYTIMKEINGMIF